MASTPDGPRSISTGGIVVGLGALALLLIVTVFQPRSGSDVAPDQRPIATAVVNELMTNGVLVDYDCLKTTAWVKRAVWIKYNVDQRRNMIVSLATVCDSQRGAYRISILDYESKRELAAFDGRNLEVDQ
jgi:hypothetical protein